MCFAGGGLATGDTGETEISEEDAQYAVSTVIGGERETKGVGSGWDAHDEGVRSAKMVRSVAKEMCVGDDWDGRMSENPVQEGM